nr:immunoglobulin light chain junction region [Macaca mulatta]
CQHGYGVPCSF